jgi:hypothetical protein
MMEGFIKESTKTESEQEKESTSFLIRIYTWVIGRMTGFMAKEYTFIRTVKNTRVNSKKE